MMLAKCSVFIATSLDGFISREDGSIDWLMEANTLVPLGEDCGYKSFIATIDVLVMGRNSYEKILSFDQWPYGELPVVVLSSKAITIPPQLQTFVSASTKSPIDLVHRLLKQGAKHLYIDGGITIQRFLANNLISEITITLIPILLGKGRSLFGLLKNDIKLHHMKTYVLDCGIVQIKYCIDASKK